MHPPGRRGAGAREGTQVRPADSGAGSSARDASSRPASSHKNRSPARPPPAFSGSNDHSLGARLARGQTGVPVDEVREVVRSAHGVDQHLHAAGADEAVVQP